MKLVLISDTHTQHSQLDLPKGQVLIHAGDSLGWGEPLELLSFAEWLKGQSSKFDRILLIGGNHDRILDQQSREATLILNRVPNLTYLQDSGIEIEGVRFWGSPWTTKFQSWYFMRKPGREMDRAWKLVPEDTQVLITHSPPKGILDRGFGYTRIGCEMLAHRLGPEGNLRPALHVFGHAHTDYGQLVNNGILHVNAALCDNGNNLVNPPVEIELPFD